MEHKVEQNLQEKKAYKTQNESTFPSITVVWILAVKRSEQWSALNLQVGARREQ